MGDWRTDNAERADALRAELATKAESL